MTDEEIKNKAKETSGGNYYYEQGFIYGFELGEEDGRKEGYEQATKRTYERQLALNESEENIAELKQKLESDELALNEATEIIAELKAQIEKMKCCQMCKHLLDSGSCLEADTEEVRKWDNFLIETRRKKFCKNWELVE